MSTRQQRANPRPPFGRNASAIEVIAGLPALNPSLKSLTFTVYEPTPGLDERLSRSADPAVRRIKRKAERVRQLTGDDLVPWEEMLAAFEKVTDLKWLVRQSLLHDPAREVAKRFELPAEEVTVERLEEVADSLPEKSVLALCSVCRLRDNSVAHVPLMDFRCPPGEENFKRVRLSLRAVGQSGAVLTSGRSYHFYGLAPLGHEEWVRFMARSLLLAPLTDARYIAHRLIAGTGVLRLTASEAKLTVPRLHRVV